MDVKLPASIAVFFSAILHSSELAAKAVMASITNNAIRAGNLILELLMAENTNRISRWGVCPTVRGVCGDAFYAASGTMPWFECQLVLSPNVRLSFSVHSGQLPWENMASE